MNRFAFVELSSQWLNAYLVPAPPLCGLPKLTAQLELGVQDKIWGVV